MTPARLATTFTVFASLALALATACGSSVQTTPSSSSSGTTLSTHARGAACAFDDQCSTHRCSADQVNGGCGECVDIQPLGHSCTGPHQGCAVSAVCHGGVCQSIKKVVGQSCAYGGKGEDLHECDDELYCLHAGNDSNGMGVCTPRVPAGGSCAVACYGCVAGANCDQEKGLCVQPPPGSCTAGTGCGDGTYCSYENGFCKPSTLPLGAVCGILNGEIVEGGCAPGSVCGDPKFPNGGGGQDTQESCLVLPAAGEPCMLGNCAQGSYCEEPKDDNALPTCRVNKAEGEVCSNDNYFLAACVEGLECRKGTCHRACD